MTKLNPEGTPSPQPRPGYCQICVKVKTNKQVCNACYADGWRVGEEMLEAIKDDPNFVIHEDGSLGVVPDEINKWGQS